MWQMSTRCAGLPGPQTVPQKIIALVHRSSSMCGWSASPDQYPSLSVYKTHNIVGRDGRAVANNLSSLKGQGKSVMAEDFETHRRGSAWTIDRERHQAEMRRSAACGQLCKNSTNFLRKLSRLRPRHPGSRGQRAWLATLAGPERTSATVYSGTQYTRSSRLVTGATPRPPRRARSQQIPNVPYR